MTVLPDVRNKTSKDGVAVHGLHVRLHKEKGGRWHLGAAMGWNQAPGDSAIFNEMNLPEDVLSSLYTA
jgi:hypothetical protein